MTPTDINTYPSAASTIRTGGGSTAKHIDVIPDECHAAQAIARAVENRPPEQGFQKKLKFKRNIKIAFDVPPRSA
jgi:hypothetical protein